MFSRFRKTLTVTRGGAGQFVDGIFQPGTQSSFTIQASVQPTTPDDVELIPAGKRDRLSYTLYSDTALKIANDNTQQPGDRVLIDGETYEAMGRQPWQNNIINHHRTVVVKEAEQ